MLHMGKSRNIWGPRAVSLWNLRTHPTGHDPRRASISVASVDGPDDAPISDDLTFDCPRCGEPAAARFYGPCEGCCVQLRASLSGAGRDVHAEQYAPKMNVTPNAVALKDS